MLFQSGFRFSPINYDMACGLLPNHFNLQANMYMADSMARANLYDVPMFNMGSFMPYGGVSIPGDFIMQYTLGQAHHQSLANGGAGIFNSDGTLNLTGNIFGGYGFGSSLGASYNPFGGIGITPWQTPGVGNGNGNGSGSGKTEEEKKAEQKMKDDLKIIVPVLNAYKKANAENIDRELADKIADAIKKSKTEDKYNAVKEVLIEIGADNLKKSIPYLYVPELVKAGYDFENGENFGYENKAHEDLVDNARQSIKHIAGADGNVSYKENNELYDGLKTLSTYFSDDKNSGDILNIISLWNENKNSKRLILALQDVVKKVPPAGTGENESRVSATGELVVPLVNALKAKAKECRKSMTPEEKEELTKLKDSLENAIGEVVKSPLTADWQALSDVYDDLYTLLRKVEAKRINKDICKNYDFLNEIVPDVVDAEIIIKDTELDLESEKISDSVIDNYREDAAVSATQRRVDSMVRSNVLEKVAEFDDIMYYQETKETDGRNYKRVFIVSNDKVQVLKDTKFNENNQLVNLGNQPVEPANVTYVGVDADKIRADYDQVKAAEEAEEAKKKAKADGAEVRKATEGKYVDKQEKLPELRAKMMQVTKDNVMEFLEGVYSEISFLERGLTIKGFFKKGVKDSTIDRESGLCVINAILALAGDSKIDESDTSFARLSEIRDMYSEKGKHDKKGTFNGLNWEFGWSPRLTHAAIIDECIESLYKDIKKAQAKGVNENA